ncbi:MAG: glycosyltransferase family 4 protein [Bifidobacterium mongoliense]|jgi:phosphatidylinositol alpha-mannosyltransferase|uniref:glycosyltransferase family 4 protein n=1 Tax=Bifidobacterium mongoliense TaxID=518643 RepID=UPI002F35DB62
MTTTSRIDQVTIRRPSTSTSRPIADGDPLHGRKLRIGIISPYSFETPGGVQFHIRDFARQLRSRGHHVEVLAPGRRTTDMPLWVDTNGTSFSIPYNGSIARLSYFGFAGAQTRRWVEQGGFDILHLHEPEAPSLSHKPLVMRHHPPLVGTFHSAFDTYPRALRCFEPYLRRYLAPLDQAICVSEAARSIARHYLPTAVPTQVIPNGIDRAEFLGAHANPDWTGTSTRPTIGFLGRMGEERKGFAVFAEAARTILERVPNARFLCAGDGSEAGRRIVRHHDADGRLLRHFEFLGRLSDADKARFYRSLSVYVAPQLGGESFGIVLVEAMSASCPVVASDLDAFRAVGGDDHTVSLFETGRAQGCAGAILALLSDDERRTALGRAGASRSEAFDWSSVTDAVLGVYARALS